MEDRSVHGAVFVRYRAAFCLRRGRDARSLRNRPLPVRIGSLSAGGSARPLGIGFFQ